MSLSAFCVYCFSFVARGMLMFCFFYLFISKYFVNKTLSVLVDKIVLFTMYHALPLAFFHFAFFYSNLVYFSFHVIYFYITFYIIDLSPTIIIYY